MRDGLIIVAIPIAAVVLGMVIGNLVFNSALSKGSRFRSWK